MSSKRLLAAVKTTIGNCLFSKAPINVVLFASNRARHTSSFASLSRARLLARQIECFERVAVTRAARSLVCVGVRAPARAQASREKATARKALTFVRRLTHVHRPPPLSLRSPRCRRPFARRASGRAAALVCRFFAARVSSFCAKTNVMSAQNPLFNRLRHFGVSTAILRTTNARVLFQFCARHWQSTAESRFVAAAERILNHLRVLMRAYVMIAIKKKQKQKRFARILATPSLSPLFLPLIRARARTGAVAGSSTAVFCFRSSWLVSAHTRRRVFRHARALLRYLSRRETDAFAANAFRFHHSNFYRLAAAVC